MFRGYVRVSSRLQKDGDSVGQQCAVLQARASQEGLPFQLYQDEAIPGTVPLNLRPAGRELMRDLQAGDTLAATRLDRLFRSLEDSIHVIKQCRERQIKVLILNVGDVTDNNGIGPLVFNLLSVLSAWEKETLARRVLDCKQHSREMNKYLGGTKPLGWRVLPDRSLEPIPEEAAAVSLILRLSGEGMSLRKIATAIQDTYGIKCSHTCVQRVIRDARIRQGAA